MLTCKRPKSTSYYSRGFRKHFSHDVTQFTRVSKYANNDGNAMEKPGKNLHDISVNNAVTQFANWTRNVASTIDHAWNRGNTNLKMMTLNVPRHELIVFSYCTLIPFGVCIQTISCLAKRRCIKWALCFSGKVWSGSLDIMHCRLFLD